MPPFGVRENEGKSKIVPKQMYYKNIKKSIKNGIVLQLFRNKKNTSLHQNACSY